MAAALCFQEGEDVGSMIRTLEETIVEIQAERQRGGRR